VAVGGVLAAGESYDAGVLREGREELGVDFDPEPLFLFRYADAATVVQSMIYRATQDGPFQLQTEEIVRGQFVSFAEVAGRAEREPFCPDGWSVLTEYRRRGCMPFVYRVTATFINRVVADEWLEWLNGRHVADCLAAGGALDAEVIAVDGESLTYEVCYRYPSRHAFAVYERDHAPRLRADGMRLFPVERGVTYRRSTGLTMTRYTH
jgi:hypothetical protein